MLLTQEIDEVELFERDEGDRGAVQGPVKLLYPRARRYECRAPASDDERRAITAPVLARLRARLPK